MAPLRIVDAGTIAVSSLTALIYGSPGIGKTSLALTAENPLLLDFDAGAHRAANRTGKAVVQVDSWQDIRDITQADIRPYSTVIVDTVGTCLDKAGIDLMAANPKLYGRGGDLTLKGYGALKSKFHGFLTLLRSSGADIILVAHSEEQQRDDHTVSRLVATGGSRNVIYQLADLIGYMERTGDGCTLTFDPTASTFGKNCHLPTFTFGDPALGRSVDQMAEVISQAKANINTEHERIKAAAEDTAALREELAALPKDPEVYSARIREMRAAGAPMLHGQILLDLGKAAGFRYDKATQSFVAPQAPAQEAAAAPVQAQPAPQPAPQPTPQPQPAATPTPDFVGDRAAVTQSDPTPEPQQPVRAQPAPQPAPQATRPQAPPPQWGPEPQAAEAEPEGEPCHWCARTGQELIERNGVMQCTDGTSCAAAWDANRQAADAAAS